MIGHNNPPPYDASVYQSAVDRATKLADAAGSWLDLGHLQTPEQAQMLADFISGARALEKEIEAARVAAKKPHDAAGKAVQEAFKRPLSVIERVLNQAKLLQTDWLKRENARLQEEQRVKAEQAERLIKEAEEQAARARMSNDLLGAVDAESKREAAELAAKEAAKQQKAKSESYTGGGRTVSLRTVKTAVIENPRAVCNYFINDPALLDCIQRLADAAIRRGEIVSGASIHEEQVAS